MATSKTVSGDLLDADVPLHHQIYMRLRTEIDDGGWVGREDQFPGEAEIAQQFGVSVITSRTALNRLAADGYIERARGRRTRVVHVPKFARADKLPAIIQTIAGAQRLFGFRVLTRGVGVAPLEACLAFGLPAGSRLWLCSRLRTFKGRPHSVTLNAQPVELGESLPLAKLQKLAMTQILRESGVKFALLRRRVSASLAPPEVARELGITISDPTLVYTFTHHDVDQVVVQWVRIWVRYDEPSPEDVFNYETAMWSTSAQM